MMEVTPKALEEIRKILSPEQNPLKGIRISIQSGTWGPKPQMSVAEKAIEGEKTVSINAVDFFFDKSTEMVLSGYIIDYNANGFKLDFMLPEGRCCR